MTTLDYLAGFFDGEGCVMIVGRGDGLQRMEISAANMDSRPLEEFAKRWGGSITAKGCRGKGGSGKEAIRRPCYSWQRSGPRALTALRALLPRLIVKAEVAELAVEFQARVSLGVGRSGKGLVPAEIAWRKEMRDKVSAMNTKRVLPLRGTED